MTAALAGAAAGAVTAAVSGQNIMKGVFMGAVSAGIAAAGGIVGQAVVGGAMSVIQGGKFGRGFISAAFASYAAGYVKGNVYARAIANAVIGGTASEIAGGKFRNGAVSSTFAFTISEAGRFGTAKRRMMVGRPMEMVSAICGSSRRHYYCAKCYDSYGNPLIADSGESLNPFEIIPYELRQWWGSGETRFEDGLTVTIDLATIPYKAVRALVKYDTVLSTYEHAQNEICRCGG